MVAVFSLKVPGWASAAGRRSLLPMALFGATEKNLFEHTDRVHPVYFPFPSQREDDVTIELPSGWKIVSVPAPQKKDGGAVVYTSEAANNNGAVRLHRTLSLNLMFVEAKSYPHLRNFFQLVRTLDDQQVLLQPAAASASN
jgi:hypothetical protein